MTLHIRPAEADDLPRIVALLAEDTIPLDREDASLPLDPAYTAAFDAIAADPNQQLVVGVLDGRVVATLQLTIIPGLSFRGLTRGNVESVRVDSACRGQRVGEQMMRWVEDACHARGCRLIQLTSTTSRTDAHRFYERLGWQRTHAGFKLELEGA